jgi:polyhydroxyalkanoate synthesis regulator phasin
MDKLTEYVIKNAELQALLSATAKKGVEKIASQYAEKFSKPEAAKELPSAQEMFSEWVKVNEQFFTELFASEDFSKVKGDTLNLSMEVKKYFESQFENAFRNFPFVFKSEIDELNKTIYSLRKQVKELQAKISGEGSVKEQKKAKK